VPLNTWLLGRWGERTSLDWVRVLERHPRGVLAMLGYVWLDVPGKVRHVGQHELEFRTE
jgi:hypothetical protein